MVLGWLVLAVMTGVSGNTPGKSALGLRVVHHGTGTPIGVGPALVRSLVLAAASLPTFGIGLATLAWTAVEDRGRQRRGWHDHLASSVVVDVRPVEVVTESVDDSPRHVVNLTAMRLIPAPAVEQPVFQAPPPVVPSRPRVTPAAATRAAGPRPGTGPALRSAPRRTRPCPPAPARSPSSSRPSSTRPSSPPAAGVRAPRRTTRAARWSARAPTAPPATRPDPAGG